MEKLKVLVVGGGIGGQTAAIALAKASFDVEIVEIQKQFNVYGVGIIQQANALIALDKIGVAEEAMRRGSPYGQVRMSTAHGHQIGLAGPPPGRFPSHNGISRKILHEILFEETQKLGINYLMGQTVVELDNRPDGIDVKFSDGSAASYDLLIEAGGIHSKIREKVFGPMAAKHMGLSVWRYPFDRHADLDTGQIYYGKRSKIGFIPMSKDRMYLFLVSAEDENDKIHEADLVSKLRDYMKEYPVKIVQDSLEQVTDPKLVNIRPIESLSLNNPWFKNRVMVIGDAAHATAPQLGSGAALAIEDAVALVEELKKADSISQALESTMARRYDRCMMVVNASEKLAEWELLEFQGKPLPEGANPGALIGKTVGGLMAPF
jgi:2-polyprenyl-6-methoxyphenol hydroxylase-like FAD-dependent oxidoreductase